MREIAQGTYTQQITKYKLLRYRRHVLLCLILFASTILAFAVQGANEQTAVQLFDYAADVKVVQNLAYITRGCQGFDVVNVQEPLKPIAVGHLDTDGCIGPLAITSSNAYAVCTSGEECFLRAINVSNPIRPTLQFKYGGLGPAYDVEAHNTLVYLINRALELEIIDVSNASSPVVLGRYTPLQEISGFTLSAFTVTVVGSTAYTGTRMSAGHLGDIGGTLDIVDVRTPSNPRLIARLSTGAVHDIAVQGTVAYVTYRKPPTLFGEVTGGMHIVDIADPTAPAIVATYERLGRVNNVQVLGSLAYIANDTDGVTVLNVHVLERPVFFNSYQTNGAVNSVYVSEDFAYIATSEGLQIIRRIPMGGRAFLPTVQR